ncbi:aldehyde dehydrogenase [Sarocladium strictum]
MAAVQHKPFEGTPVPEISSRISTLRTTFRSGRTKPFSYRIKQLRKLYWAIADNNELLKDALYKDMRKCGYEATLHEIAWTKSAIMDLIDNAEEWLKDEPVVGMPFQAWAMRHHIRHTPMGLILVIGAFNFPLMLNICGLAGAIAAGNCVVVKPSESAPNCAMAIRKVIEQALDPEAFVCVTGEVAQTQALLDNKFDKIAFIGGTKVGTIIAKKAAETLTPVVLELGGRNPAFITRNADVKLAARRLMFQKTMNAGQVCFSHNYVLVERAVLSEFISAVNQQFRVMFPKGPKESPDYARIVNAREFGRLKKMLDGTKGKIVMGGKMDEEELFIEPTAVLVDDFEDSMMAQESFGPIWSIMAWDSLDEAVDIANNVDPTPLSLFTFGTNEENEKVLASVTSGTANINEGCAHGQFHPSPNCGVGSSGTGQLNGIYSLKTFSHQRTVAKGLPSWLEKAVRVRYMPYQYWRLEQLQKIVAKKPNFDRDGNVVKGLSYWIKVVLSLGAKSAKGLVLRWGVLLAMALALGLGPAGLPFLAA